MSVFYCRGFFLAFFVIVVFVYIRQGDSAVIFFLCMSLSGFGIGVIPASLKAFGDLPSYSLFKFFFYHLGLSF